MRYLPTRGSLLSYIAVIGLTSFSPILQAAMLLAAISPVIWAESAHANTIPGVGTVVKKLKSKSTIVVPSDDNGETRLTGLTPGEYSIRLIEGAEEVIMKVGRDGRLAYILYEDVKLASPVADEPRMRQRPQLPVVLRWIEQIKFNGGKSGVKGAFSIAFAGPCDEPPCPVAIKPGGMIDLNNHVVEQLSNGTAHSLEVAHIIAAERNRNGPFTGIEDFALRVCTQTDVDFSQSSIKMGDILIIVLPRSGTKSNLAGFQCRRDEEGIFNLYGKKHNYVGHVTLLR
ncbi:hypothetical protein LPB140_03330 [Sphingorhabdus lutea]|uniref:Uncharacterized protein n=1 Tax=Sphingorhabdus lutea TaxID=1913578 RepID=A0A1L3JA46_9SPHN|nr:hypothetical protein [Sphingorhabdus lutea]APG62006.1 hypothetical protein LPB140_03330 [Sphingorhabdus lutea]